MNPPQGLSEAWRQEVFFLKNNTLLTVNKLKYLISSYSRNLPLLTKITHFTSNPLSKLQLLPSGLVTITVYVPGCLGVGRVNQALT